MGKRGRVQKKYRQIYSLQLTMQDSTNEKKNLVAECIHVETPSVSDISGSNESINDFEDCTPELVLLESKKMGYYDDMSPKMNGRLPKLKLNLDIPENDDTDDVDDEKNNTIREKDDFESSKDLEKTLSVEKVFESENEESTGSTLKANDFIKCFSLNLKTHSDLMDVPRKDLTSLSGYFQIPSSTFNLPESVEASSSNHVFASRPVQSINSEIGNIDSNNPGYQNDNQLVKMNSNIRDDCLLSDKKCKRKSFSKECCIKIDGDENLESTNPKTVLNIYEDKSWDSTLENDACINLPVVSDVDSKTTGSESRITVLNNASDVAFLNSENNSYIYLKKLKSSFIKIKKFCSRLAGKCIIWIKKGCEGIKDLLSVIITTSNPSPLANSELTQVIAVVKSENERILSVLSEQISSLSQELIEVRVGSEANLKVLKSEMNKVETANIQLTTTNDNLVKELKILQEKIQEIKSASLLESSAITKNSISVIPPLPPAPPVIKVSGPPLPPPPPPPPPPPMLLTSKLNYSITPNNKFNNNTPVNKFSTPLTSRPAITVEDLLKVTLKKAPQNSKAMENRRNTIPGPRGPVISLDMLRNVKLKSARRRSLDQHKSPRSASRVTKNRSQFNSNLSPRAEGSISRLLKSGDANKRVLKKTQYLSSNSENDLSRDTPPTKLAIALCKSESILN